MSDVNRAVVRRTRRLYEGRNPVLLVVNDVLYRIDNPMVRPVSLGSTPTATGFLQYDRTRASVLRMSLSGAWRAPQVYGPYSSFTYPFSVFGFNANSNGRNGVSVLSDNNNLTVVSKDAGATIQTISSAPPVAPLDRQTTAMNWIDGGVLMCWHEAGGVLAPSWGLYYCSPQGAWSQMLSFDANTLTCFYVDLHDQVYFSQRGVGITTVYRVDGGSPPILVPVASVSDGLFRVAVGNGLIVGMNSGLNFAVTFGMGAFGGPLSSVAFGSCEMRQIVFNGLEFVAYDSLSNTVLSSVDGHTWQRLTLSGSGDITADAVVIPE